MHKNDIEPTQLQLIDSAVQNAFPNESWRLIEPVGGGLSTSVLYKIGVGEETDIHPDGKLYVARLSDPAHPHNNLPREYDAMKLAAEQKLAPVLYYADAQAGVALIDFVEGRTLNATIVDGSAFMDSLADLVHSVHQGQSFQPDVRLTEKVEFIFGQMRPDLASTPLVDQAMTRMRALAPILNDPDDTRPSHCDINPGNLLFDGCQLWLIDWAAAAQESFYFDLACCANFFFYESDETETAFLKAYFERPLTAQEEEKYARMRIFVAIYYGLIFVYLSGMQGAPLLTPQEIDGLPAYPQFMSRMGQGKERLDSPVSQQRLGFVYLQELK